MRPARRFVRALRFGRRRRNDDCHTAFPRTHIERGRFRGRNPKDSISFLGFCGVGIGGTFHDRETRESPKNIVMGETKTRHCPESRNCDGREDSVKQLIVNADDFGITENVNRGILDTHRDGIATSTTLLANGRTFEAAAAASKRFHRLGIGVHLDLTEGKPMADATKIPTLVNRGGRLYMAPACLWTGIFTGQVSLS